MRLRDAIAGGFIIQTAPGVYAAAEASQEAAPEVEPEQNKDELGGEAIEQEAEAVLGNLVAGTDPNDQISAVKQVVASPTGEVSPELLAHVAGTLGTNPEALAGQIETIRSGFEAQARTAVEAMGVNPDAVFEHAWANHPDQMKRVMNDHAMKRSTDGYKSLARNYIENLDTIAPEAVLGADFADGVTAREDGGKIILTDANGTTYEWRTAVRSGIVSLG